MDRPVVFIAAAFAAGICVASWAVWVSQGFTLSILMALFFFIAGGVLAVSHRAPGRTRPASVVFWAFAAGMLLALPQIHTKPGDALSELLVPQGDNATVSTWKPFFPNDVCTVEGRIRLADLETGVGTSSVFLLDVDTVLRDDQRIPCSGGMAVRWEKPSMDVFAHERVRITGRYSISLARINPNTGSYEDYLRARGINTSLQAVGAQAVKRLETPRCSMAYWASRLRNAQATYLSRVVPEKALPFVQAIWLGYRTSIAGEEYDAYVASGTAHILSVSGLHMAMIYMTSLFLLKLIMRRPKLRTILCMAILIAFTLMSGLRASAIRSALMLLVYLSADLLDREPDTPTALGESALLLLIWDPLILFDGGFLLSFLSVASMLLFCKPVSEKLEWLPSLLRGAVSTALAVQFLPLPLAIHYFHVIPLMSIPANLILVPLSTVALWLCFITTVTAWLFHPLGLLFGQTLGWTVSAIHGIAETISRPSFTHAILPSPTFWGILAYYGLLLCLSVLLFRRPEHLVSRERWIRGVWVLAFLMVAVWRTPFSEPTIVFLDVGHGDATFIRGGEGRSMLVDTGDASMRMDVGRRVIAPFLWSNDVTALDYIVLTHMDRDHIGGTFYLLDHFPVKAVLVGPGVTESPNSQSPVPSSRQEAGQVDALQLSGKLIAKCRERGIPLRTLQAGDAIALPEMTVEVLHPPQTWPHDGTKNESSLVLRLTWNGVRLLLTGDVEKEAESVLSRGDCRAEILKAPHHGSDTSSSAAFIAAVQPTHTVISTAGEHRRIGLKASVLRRYAARNVQVWRTDYLGGIQLFAAKEDLRFESTRAKRGYPVGQP